MADNWLWETSTTQSIVSVGQLPLLGPARVRHVAGSIMASPKSPENGKKSLHEALLGCTLGRAMCPSPTCLLNQPKQRGCAVISRFDFLRLDFKTHRSCSSPVPSYGSELVEEIC